MENFIVYFFSRYRKQNFIQRKIDIDILRIKFENIISWIADGIDSYF